MKLSGDRQPASLARLSPSRSDIAAAVHRRVVRKVRRQSPLIGPYISDIEGGFDPRLYRVVTGMLRPLCADVELQGPIEGLRDWARRGTLMFASTHSSNLDSILLAMALKRAGLPACVYAAGKHMYRNPVVAALMRNLGAYRVDRAMRSRLYTLVLSEYTTELLERGLHSVVFPGATRCRSNEVERSLKLGLLGAALRADAQVFVVPVTINYATVLEAETLIRYHLEGRSHERIVGEDLLGWGRLAKLAQRVWALSKSVVIRFDAPLERPASSRQLGADLRRAFERNTVLLSTHVVARALYDLAAARAGTGDAQQLLRLGEAELSFASPVVYQAISDTADVIRSAPGQGMLHRGLDGMSPQAIAQDASRAWDACHRVSVVRAGEGKLVVSDPKLVYFYRNRTSHIGGEQ